MTFHVATQVKKLHVLAASLDHSYAAIFRHLTVTSRQTKQIYSSGCTDTYHIHACTHHFNYHIPREHGLHLHTAYIYILRIFITNLLRHVYSVNYLKSIIAFAVKSSRSNKSVKILRCSIDLPLDI